LFEPADPVAVLARTEANYQAVRHELARREEPQTTLYADTGDGFRAALAWSLPVGAEGEGEFAFTFQLPESLDVRGLRWDPVECRLCTVSLAEVRWEDEQGSHVLPLDSVSSNGRCLQPGRFEFETLDPMLFLPVSGRVRSLTVRGWWTVLSPSVSFAALADRVAEGRRQAALVEEHKGRIAAQEEQLRAQESELRGQDEQLRVQVEQLRAQESELRGRDEQLRSQESELRGRDEQLQEREDQIDALEQELRAKNEHLVNVTRQLDSVLLSKKWRLAVAITNVLSFFPRRCRAGARAIYARR
jgi:hypothetical protein